MNVNSVSLAATTIRPASMAPGAYPADVTQIQRLPTTPAALTRQAVPLELLHGDLMLEYIKANSRASSVYAQVVKDGKVVATLDNDGSATAANADSGLLDVNGGPFQGPDLAQWRAAQIARAVGGEVRLADTAQRQEDWKAPTLSREGFAAYLAQRLTS